MSNVGNISFKMREYALEGGEKAEYLKNQSITLTDRVTQLKLTDKSLSGLKSRLELMLAPKLNQKGTNIQEGVLKHLEPLTRLPYSDKKTFDKALNERIADMTNIEDSDKKKVYRFTWRFLSRRRDGANIVSRFETRLTAIEKVLKDLELAVQEIMHRKTAR